MKPSSKVRLPDGTLEDAHTAYQDKAAWESICNGCGLCCKLMARSGSLAVRTHWACPWLDRETGQCSDYENRPLATCAELRPANIPIIGLPESCPYVGGEGVEYDENSFKWGMEREKANEVKIW